MFIDSDEEKETVRTRILPTKYGDVFCLEVGQPGQPLIMVIHGSGPKNSSKQYEYLLHEYAVRISTFERYYILAIDCPGYGRSTGSKEAIKTFPLEFMKNILEVLGYKSYYALFGHSQGGAAIFNAVFDCPTLTEYMVQERPVCGNIARFNGFDVPTLLVYDIEDDGHPIWQGKQLFKQLKNSDFYTFRTSVSPYYVPDNIWNLMLQFFDKRKNDSKNKRVSRSHSRESQRIRPRGFAEQRKRQLSQQVEKKERHDDSGSQREKKVKVSLENEEQRRGMVEIEKIEQMPSYLNIPLEKIEESPMELDIIDQKQECSYLIVRNKNKNPELKENQLEIEKKTEKINQEEIIEKKQHNCNQSKIQVKIQKGQTKPSPLQKQQTSQFNENKCSLCLETYFHPTKINCKHVFCWRCITEAMLVNPKCPLCRRNIEKREEDKSLHQELKAKMDSQDLNRRLFQYRKFLRMMDTIVFVQVGNTSILLNTKQSSFSQTKKKYNWELFVTETHNFKFECVEFNINMGNAESKPVKVRQPPWTFANRGTFEFGCEIKIIPKSQYFNPLVVIYRVCLEPGKHSKKVAIRRKEFK